MFNISSNSNYVQLNENTWFPLTQRRTDSVTLKMKLNPRQALKTFTLPNQVPFTLMLVDNPYESLSFYLHCQTGNHSTVKIDYEITLKHPEYKNKDIKKCGSFEFKESNSYIYEEDFLDSSKVKRYTNNNQEMTLVIKINQVQEKKNGIFNHIVDEIDKVNKLFKYNEMAQQSLIHSFYFMPFLKRCILEIPRSNLNAIVESEPQQSRNWDITENRLTSAIKMSGSLGLAPSNIYEFETITTKMIKKIAQLSDEANKEELIYHFYMGLGGVYNETDMHAIKVEGDINLDILNYMKRESLMVRMIEQFPPVLFISLPTSDIAGNDHLRNISTTFREDFYFEEVLTEDEVMDPRSKENHYILYSVWCHEHPSNNAKQGEFFTFLRPLDQPHWVKVSSKSVEEVHHFNYVLGCSAGKARSELADNSSGFPQEARSWKSTTSYAYMLVYVLESETKKLFNEEDSRYNINLDDQLSKEKKLSYDEMNDAMQSKDVNTTTTTTTTTTISPAAELLPSIDDLSLEQIEVPNFTGMDELKIFGSPIDDSFIKKGNGKSSSNNTTSTTTTTSSSGKSNTTNASLNKYERRLGISKLQNENLKKDVEFIKKNTDTNKKELDRLKKTSDDYRKQIDQSNDKLKKANKERDNIRSDVDRQKSFANNQLKSLEALRKELAATKNQKSAVEAERDTIHKQVQEEKKKSNKTDPKLLQKRLEAMELENSQLSGESSLTQLDHEQLTVIGHKLSKSIFNINEQLLTLSKARVCVICSEQAREICFLPCSHFVTCLNCSTIITKCPICRKDINKKIKVINN
ncbi:RING zinc finger-containing protein [Heterostelium album PN500]|uniref:RING zinc finger-containing protein n=1 Tax=Heterostelium pallidum (strain ATCC 26659 / Pp 5 / PN500) TaxID=670386 RepID=D3BMT8_HETP5|nr:RING zinc finger-containing protein [Heterostelium album PN500]EFA77300.1 RING zinc finger-containing protein [Heterostelium album PN500]|eukprot:XP_020429429.1 RING zinc finger-containing protein [Heterostelium album PN500]